MPVDLFQHIARPQEQAACTLYEPSPDLRPVVSTFFLYNAAESSRRELAFADGQPCLGFMPDPPHTYTFIGHDTVQTRRYAFLSGVLLEGVYIDRAASAQRLFGVRFTERGLYHLLRTPLKNLRGAVSWEVSDIFGARADALVDAVLAGRTVGQWIAVLETFLRERLRDTPAPDGLYDEAMQAIRHSGGQLRIDSLKVGYKWLERKCITYMGMTPKEYARLHRFLGAFFALRQADRGGAGVAFEHGYYDQNHFIREFRRFTARTPREFLHGSTTGHRCTGTE